MNVEGTTGLAGSLQGVNRNNMDDQDEQNHNKTPTSDPVAVI
jgi:hypothetical protein